MFIKLSTLVLLCGTLATGAAARTHHPKSWHQTSSEKTARKAAARKRKMTALKAPANFQMQTARLEYPVTHTWVDTRGHTANARHHHRRHSRVHHRMDHSTIALSFTGDYTKNQFGQGVLDQSANNTGGYLISYRYKMTHWNALELDYGWARNTQDYRLRSGLFGEQSDIHQFTASYVQTFSHFAGLYPFLEAGLGFVHFSPTHNFPSLVGALGQSRGTFVFGGGVDIKPVRWVGVRIQYRGLVYRTPDFELQPLNTGKRTVLSEPSIGLVFSF